MSYGKKRFENITPDSVVMQPQNLQVDAYLEKRPLKQHEEELLEIIKCDWGNEFDGRVLDIGCATGAFLKNIRILFPYARLIGIDSNESMISLAKQDGIKDIEFVLADAIDFKPEFHYDIIIASGIFSVFEDYRESLKNWTSWLSTGGILYIFGRFNSRDIDTIVRYRNNYKCGDWEAGLTSYSTRTISTFLKEWGFESEFRRFNLKIDLQESADPIRTYTINCADGSKMVVNGANLIAEQFFLIVRQSG